MERKKHLKYSAYNSKSNNLLLFTSNKHFNADQ